MTLEQHNKDLNCMGLLIGGFFSTNTTVVYDLLLAESADVEP